MKKFSVNYQIVFLSFISFFNIFYAFMGDNFPDNALKISSNSQNLNFLSYYFFSLLSYICYYTGIWIVAVFIILFVLNSLLLSRRTKKIDHFVSFVLTFFFFTLSYLAAPKFIGDGLFIFSDKYLSPFVLFSVLFASLVTLTYICVDSEFVKGLSLFYSLIKKKFNNFQKLVLNEVNKVYQKKKVVTDFLVVENFENKVGNLLKKKNSNTNSVSVSVSVSEDNYVNDSLSMNNDLDKSRSFHHNEKPINDQLSSDTKKEGFKTRHSDRSSFFKSETLIDCISGHGQHGKVSNPDNDYFNFIQENIEEKLSEFKVEAKIVNVLKGPVVDTFELDLGPAVKVSKVMGLSDDIGLALSGAPIRIVYPMKGRSTIGIEVPRNPRDIIFLDEVLRSEQFNSSRYRLPVAMGRDAFGEVSVVDLASMPHMLVAGATGAGKSVFINTLLVSLIIKMSPKQMKLLLIDPKQLELALYQELPHLMLPVITEAKSASIALLWAVQEMERRYSILKELGVKNIEGFNKKIKNCPAQMLSRLNQYYIDQDDEGYELPYLVIIIDEFADLILTKSGKEIEDNVNRLAAKARAAGIHIVLATQRPSTDVVTGVIKANFPTRVAFRVTTATDSRVILDQLGAEKLLGKGDMLYKHGVDVMRVHSSYVEEEEIEQLVKKLSTIPTSFNSVAMNFVENGELETDSDVSVSFGAPKATGDQLYDDAVQVVIEQGSASASMLQRRLRVGYNRAANLIEEMENNGIVGPQQGSKPRDILITRSE